MKSSYRITSSMINNEMSVVSPQPADYTAQPNIQQQVSSKRFSSNRNEAQKHITQNGGGSHTEVNSSIVMRNVQQNKNQTQQDGKTNQSRPMYASLGATPNRVENMN